MVHSVARHERRQRGCRVREGSTYANQEISVQSDVLKARTLVPNKALSG